MFEVALSLYKVSPIIGHNDNYFLYTHQPILDHARPSVLCTRCKSRQPNFYYMAHRLGWLQSQSLGQFLEIWYDLTYLALGEDSVVYKKKVDVMIEWYLSF